MKMRILSLFAAAALALSFQAHSANLTLNFTATEANGIDLPSFDPQISQWYLELDPFSPFEVSQGDQIDATVTFNDGASHTIPAANQWVSLTLLLRSSAFPAGDVEVGSGTATFFLGGIQGTQIDFNAGTTSQIAAGGTYPGGVAQTFDTVNLRFVVSTLSATTTIDNGALFSTSFNAVPEVPEPATNAMLLAGLGLLGAVAARSRRRLDA